MNDKISNKNKELGLVKIADPYSYFLNENKLKFSSTEIANESDFDYSKIPNIEYLKEIGTLMHVIAEDVAKFKLGLCPQWEEKDDLYANVKRNVEKELEEYEIINAEALICSPNLSIGGTLDLLAKKGDEVHLIDYKTSSAVYPSHRWQLNMYNQFLKNIYGIKVDQMFVIKIDKKTGDTKKHKVKFKEENVVKEFVIKRIKTLTEKDL